MFTALLLLATLAPCQFPVCTPTFVVEHYAAVAVLIDPECSTATPRLFFIRDGRIFADRLLTDDMVITACGAGYTIQWADWCSCQRLIFFDDLCVIEAKRTYSDDGPWWMAGRPMVELALPAEVQP